MKENKVEVPKWVLNKRKYNAERRKSLGLTKTNIDLPIEKVDEINNWLKENNMTKIQLVKEIIEREEKKLEEK